MSNTVLTGLVYHICELYIDDVLIHGRDIESFLANVRKVFERLREFNVVVNPAKTKLGLARRPCRVRNWNFVHRGKAVKSAEISVTRNSKEFVADHRISELLQRPCA